MRYSHIRVEPISAHVGAEISEIDLTQPIPDAVFGEIRRALGDYGVVFFRGQQLTPEQHVGFAERFAPIDINRFFAAVPGHPMIAEVRKEPEQTRNIGGGWHTDHSYDREPALGSMLYAREVPQTGGDALFAGMYVAYDALSDGLKQMLEGLRACHSNRHVFGPEAMARRGDLNGRCQTAWNRDPGLECAPGGGRFQAAGLTICWACCSSNCTGLRYPSAEWSLRAL
jgi:taurine dioxygenase